jgi:hypothetical protein
VNTEQLIDRVEKLLALAGSPNVHEAAAAAARAQALISRHRLQGLLDRDDSVIDDVIEDSREEPLWEGRRLRKWMSVLATALAELNGCVAYTWVQGKHRSIVVVGRKEDRRAVRALWTGLVPRIEWLSATGGQQAGEKGKKYHDSFRIGAVQTIAGRLRAASDAEHDQLQTASIVLVDVATARRDEAVQRFVRERLHLKKGRSIRMNHAAWSQGRTAGYELDLP